MKQAQLKFTNPETAGADSLTVEVLAVKGATDPDEFELFPGIQHNYLNGDVQEQVAGFRRLVTVDIGVITTLASRKKVLYFIIDANKQLACSLTVPTGVTSALQSGGSLSQPTAFYYVITAIDEVGETIASSETTKTTDVTNKKIKLDWNAVTNARRYRIFRSTSSGVYGASSFLASVDAPTITYTDDGSVSLSFGTPPVSAAYYVALADATHFSNEWKYDTELMRSYRLDLRERSIRTTFPV